MTVLFNDPAQKVRETICWFYEVIARNHQNLYNDQVFAQDVIPKLMKLIMDADRVSISACKAIEELADKNHTAANNETQSNCLTPYFKELIDILMSNSVRTNTKEGAEIQRVSYMTMCVLV